ncbi:MAG: protein phosphatase, partial [Frankiales bacterium]|nr:protein phosphatase [Frankiales bacterium]
PARRRPAAEAEPGAPSRRTRRTAVVVAAVLGVLLLGAGTGWAYVRSQYYVGVDEGRVAVFRGVTGSVAGIPLSDVERRTDLDMERLSEIETERLQEGIVAADEPDAERIVARLEEAAAADCADAADAAGVLPAGCPALPVPTPSLTVPSVPSPSVPVVAPSVLPS